MPSFPSTDLRQKLGDVLAAAKHEPVAITSQEARYVLMSIREYEARLQKDERQAYAVEEMLEATHVGRGSAMTPLKNGEVWTYEYLWRREHAVGTEHGRTLRPTEKPWRTYWSGRSILPLGFARHALHF